MIRLGAALLLALALTPSEAQEARKRIGVLVVAVDRSNSVYASAFKRLAERGWVEGRNLVVEWRNPQDDMAALARHAADLVKLRSDVIVTIGAEAPLKAARAATTSLPLVFVAIDYDPVARGYVASLGKPGGNATGVSLNQLELTAKRLEILNEAFPKLKRLAVFWDPISGDQLKAAQTAAGTLGIALSAVELGVPLNLQGAFHIAAQSRADALMVLLSPLFLKHLEEMNSLAVRAQLPTIGGHPRFAATGGLMSYGPSFEAMFVLMADQVDRILRGARPADLPVQQPTTFSFVVNLRTAKALGVTLPQATLSRADRFVE